MAGATSHRGSWAAAKLVADRIMARTWQNVQNDDPLGHGSYPDRTFFEMTGKFPTPEPELTADRIEYMRLYRLKKSAA